MADTKISGATVLSGTGLVSTPAARAGSTTAYRRVDNLSAVAAPAVGDDSGDGFHIGSRWLRSDTGERWDCIDATLGAAIWIKRPSINRATQFPFLSTSGYLTNPVASITTGALSANSFRIAPIVVPYRRAFTKIAFELTAGSVSTSTRFGLYYSDPASDYKPTTLVAGTDGGAIDTSSGASAAKKETTFTSIVLDPGVYWGAIVSDGAPTVRCVNTGDHIAGYDFANNNPRAYAATIAFGALGDISATSWAITALSMPIIGIR